MSSAWDSYRRRSQFWKSVPASSLALLCVGVFCLFGTIGILSLMTDVTPPSWGQGFAFVFYCGGAAVLLLIAGVRQKYLVIPFLLAANIVASVWLNRMMAYNHPAAGLHPRPHSPFLWLGETGVLTLSAGYAFFMFFFSREGTRYFRVHAEIELARELHQALVPTIQRTIGEFEIYGASIPSGEVGGDLVDLVERGDGVWTAYVADVSGHGVSPGVLMAMFKATVRTRMLAGCDGAKLLEGTHEALYPLKTSNMFVTAGFIQAQGNRLTLSLAGHPALMHYRRQGGQVCEYASADLPLGILPEQTFSARDIDCEPGDILLLLTDGITEAADPNGTELGSGPVKSGLREWANLPLPELFQNIRELALKFGKQEDDQTMLLVRRMGTGS
jgi:hypothetical protein